MYHLEAAIGSHRDARFNLGNHKGIRGNYVKAMKHKLIAAKLGDDDALEQVKKLWTGSISEQRRLRSGSPWT